MSDPYEILGIARGASFEEIRAAYRRACKTKHPDMGGSQAAFVELQAAYEQILHELKRGYQKERAQETERPAAEETARRRERDWEKVYRDIEEELDELRRAADAQGQRMRAMRTRAWESGEHVAWAKLTWRDFTHFINTLLRSGLKGLVLVIAALVGIGSVLLQANVVSGLIMLGSGIGLLISIALKNDKGGIISGGLLLFGIMTIWLPPVRAALFTYPFATISVLICLGLIFKFTQQGGIVGFATGGVLAIYVIGVIAADVQRQEQVVRNAAPIPEPRSASIVQRSEALQPPPPPEAPVRRSPPSEPSQKASTEPFKPVPVVTTPLRQEASRPVAPPVQPPPPPPQPRILLAAKGAVLKFVEGVPYQLKLRTGLTTQLEALRGTVAFYRGDQQVGECMNALQLFMQPDHAPYAALDRMVRACGSDAVLRVVTVQ